MMAVWYLDNDDEITDAVARLRGASDEHVVFVVPPGSRIATGRINFKLLAREAGSREMMLAIASPDEQVRALATSAGVLAAVTPDEAVAALERGEAPPEQVAATSSGPAVSAPAPTDSGNGSLVWSSQRLRFATVIVLVIAIVGGYIATQALPTAEITLIPRVATLGPLEVTVMASADAVETDVDAGLIMATTVTVPLVAQDSYGATGTETIETRAIGEVVFSAPDQEFEQEIAAGTRVLTPAGTAFGTTETVTLAISEGGPSQVSAAVEALEPGDAGNVPVETISAVPSLESQGIAVTNPVATSGGRFDETALVTAADYDAAAVDLRNRLTGELAAHLRDPANTPEGLTLYAETAVLGPLELEPPSGELLGTTATDFSLSAAAAARVLAVDETSVDEVAHARLLAGVPAGLSLVKGSLMVEHGEGDVEGDGIAFRGSASGAAAPLIDTEVLIEELAGLPVSEARAILEALGTATVNVWPGFLDGLPTDRERITLDVSETSTTE